LVSNEVSVHLILTGQAYMKFTQSVRRVHKLTPPPPAAVSYLPSVISRWFQVTTDSTAIWLR